MNNYFQKLVQKLRKKHAAFTLIEMLIVLVVVALLMAIIIPNVAGQKTRIEKQARHDIAQIVEAQINTYRLVEADDDVSLNDLLSNGYITEKQKEQAETMLNLEAEAVITTPIAVSE